MIFDFKFFRPVFCQTHIFYVFRPFSDDNDWEHFYAMLFLANFNLMGPDRRAKVENEETTEIKKDIQLVSYFPESTFPDNF